MRIHTGLPGLFLIVGLVIALVNIGLFSFIRDDTLWPILKNGLIGVNIDSAFAEIPVYPDAILVGSSAKQLRFSYTYQTIRESSGSVPQVSKWYTQALEERGWKVGVSPSDANAQTEQYIVFEKRWIKQLRLSLSRSTDGTKTMITVELGPKYQDDDEL